MAIRFTIFIHLLHYHFQENENEPFRKPPERQAGCRIRVVFGNSLCLIGRYSAALLGNYYSACDKFENVVLMGSFVKNTSRKTSETTLHAAHAHLQSNKSMVVT